jgi:hypothetical protein
MTCGELHRCDRYKFFNVIYVITLGAILAVIIIGSLSCSDHSGETFLQSDCGNAILITILSLAGFAFAMLITQYLYIRCFVLKKQELNVNDYMPVA